MNTQLLSELEERIRRIERVEGGYEAGDAQAIVQELLDHAAAVAGAESPEYGLALRIRASLYRNHGDAQRAVEEYTRALPLVLKAGDEGLVQAAQTLTSLGGLYQHLGQAAQADDAQRRAMELIDEYAAHPQRYAPPAVGDDDSGQPEATNIVAMLAQGLATAREAVSLQEGLQVFDRLAGNAAAAPVMRLAILLGRAAFEGKHGNPAAPETFARAWVLAHSAAPSTDFPLPSQWTQLGNLANHGGRTAETLEAARRLQNWPRLRNARQYLKVRSAGLRLAAVAAVAGGEPRKPEEALRQWLEFCVSSFGRDAEETAEVQVELGHFLIDRGRAGEAVPMLKQAATTRASSPAHPNVQSGDAYFYLGLALDKSGDDTEAMPHYQAAYRFYSIALGPADPHATRAAVHLAEVARVAHDYESAQFWFRHTLQMAGESDRNRTPEIALALNNLAEALLATGRADEAAPLAEKGLEIRRQLFGVESPEYGRSLGVVALIALKRGDRPRFDLALHDFESRSSGGHLSLRTDVAVGYLEMRGDYREAIELCEGALRRLEDPGQPPDDSLMPGQRITLHLQLGGLHARLQQWAHARRHMLDAFRIETVFLSDEAGRRSQRQMQQILGESRSRISALLDVLAADPEPGAEDVKAAYQVLQQRKGMETRLLGLQKLSFVADRALTSASEERLDKVRQEVAALVTSLRRARQAWLEALLRQVEDPQSDPEELTVRTLRDDTEYLESRLASFVGEGSRDFAVMGVTSSTPVMQPGEAVVEYFLAETPAPVYYAFVVVGEAVHLAPLGDAASVHQALAQLRRQIVDAPPPPGDRDPAWRRRGRFIANRLLKPLLPRLEGISRIYVVPDAELFTLPFDLLPLDDGRLAIDRWTITHLWNGGERGGFHLFLGSPAAPDGPVVLSAPSLSSGGQPARWRFAELPSAAREGATVAEKIGAAHFEGAQATKAAVLGSERAEILHFATHSFYIPRAAAEEMGAAADLPDTLLFRARARLADPMHRSGIALAGADQELSMPTAASPGILFGTDVLDLDLRNTDLAVLSSCQSGLGDPRPGDGIQGLRRAFRAAGVKTVVSSLWKVPDEATHDFMVEFYDRLLAKTPRGQALREAKLALRERYRNDPLFWAGFVLDGLDQPLFRFSPLRGFKVANMSGVFLSYDRGLEQMQQQRWDDAIKSFEFVLYSRTAENDMRAKAGYHRAGIFRRTGRLQEALEAYDALISDLRTPPEARSYAVMDRALTKRMLGDANGAYLDYSAALSAPDLSAAMRAQLLVNRGVLLSNMDDTEGAIADWSEALALPGAPPDQCLMALQNRADLRRRMQDYPGAIADANALFEMRESKGTSQRENTWLIVALCHAESGNMPGAMAAVRTHFQERKSPLPHGASKKLAKCRTVKELTELIATLIQIPSHLPSGH